ncbi:hypothetical protein E4K73_25845 [Streptomyces sp. IB201691-2A2]|nr:hypothetical protein E4K73_25845 [Streptomyces sp. IB201691-2A2]
MARDHRSECVRQMQGQMHVHVPELDLPIPLLGHFFRDLLAAFLCLACLLLVDSCVSPLKPCRFCNRTSTAWSDLVADCGP